MSDFQNRLPVNFSNFGSEIPIGKERFPPAATAARGPFKDVATSGEGMWMLRRLVKPNRIFRPKRAYSVFTSFLPSQVGLYICLLFFHHFLRNSTDTRVTVNDYSFAFLSAFLIAKKPHTASATAATTSITMNITIHHSRLYPTISTFMELLLTTV